MSVGGAAGLDDPGLRRRLGVAASVALVAVAVLLAFVGSGGEDEDSALPSAPHLVDAAELAEAESELGHPVYWAGPLPDRRLELDVEPDGSVYLRYLPPGAAVGSNSGAYLTVGTYPLADAQAAIRRTAKAAGVSTGVGRVADGGIVLENPESKGSVYLAYPGSDLQIEVYDPAPGRAMELIEAGEIRPVG
jgi:hypothetical protein